MTNKEEEDLADRIMYHKRKYYDGEPEISDSEYDKLEEKLRMINSNHPVLQIVGTPKGGKVNHSPPMLSSDKATTLDEVVKWSAKINDRSLSAGYKVDGLSLSIIYQNGRLIQAATRGNGISGDDVTLSVLRINEIPKTIPVLDRINVRGEIYMKISEFIKVNFKLPKEQKFSSPRNLAVGTLRQKDTIGFQNRNLSFKAFDVIGIKDDPTIQNMVELLQAWGFDTADFQFIHNNTSNEIDSIFNKIEAERSLLDFEIDGVIFKYNEFQDRIQAGSTEHHPKWQIAWKFKSEKSETIINKIIWQVGRTGALTPVAIVEPVELKGALIRRATLHNAEFVETLNIAVKDRVNIQRAGDVIPKITSVVEKTGDDFEFPTHCPSCNNVVYREGVNLMCNSEVCREKDIQTIIHWLRVADIDHLGDRTVEKLYDLGFVQHYADLYTEEISEELLIRHFGKNGSKMKSSIEHSRNLPFNKFLAGLGIPSLGKKLGKELAKHYQSLEKLQETSVEELTSLEGISDLTASYILSGIHDKNNINKLLDNHVNIIYGEKKVPKQKAKNSTPSLADFWGDDEALQIQSKSDTDDSIVKNVGKGRKVYITGSVEGHTKKSLEELAENLGFEWSTSISRNLDLLVYGKNAGNAKLDKARGLKVQIYSWDEFVSKYNQ